MIYTIPYMRHGYEVQARESQNEVYHEKENRIR